jgi:hypothetical protein
VRLAVVEHGHTGSARVILGVVRRVMRQEPPSILKTVCYRSGLFGRDFSALVHEVMRGPSDWSVAERELFAAYTSRLNQCPF